MKAGMIKLICYTFKNIVFDIKWFFEKVYMKYITHEMVNENIFPLFEPVDPIKEYKRDVTIEELIERLG